MKIRKIDSKEFKKKLYKSYKKDFPKIERAYFYIIKKKSREGLVSIYILEDGKDILGYALNIETEKYVLIWYIAIVEMYRKRGYGTELVNILKEKYKKENKSIFIEVERSGYGKDEQENEIREKRINFYKRLNFKQINLLANMYATDYEIYLLDIEEDKMENTQRVKEIWTQIEYIYTKLYGKREVAKHIKLEYKTKEETIL